MLCNGFMFFLTNLFVGVKVFIKNGACVLVRGCKSKSVLSEAESFLLNYISVHTVKENRPIV